MKTLQKLVIAAAATLFLAAVINSPNQSVLISTNTGDTVVADINKTKVTLLAAVKISRKKETIVKVLPADNLSFEATQIVIIEYGWFLANIITGSTTSSTTGVTSGRAWEYASPNFVVPMKKNQREGRRLCAKTPAFVLRVWEFASCEFQNA